MARGFVLAVVAVALALAASAGALNAWVDPFAHYHRPIHFPARFYPEWQRYENPGIAKHYDYDRVVTGSSLMECVLPSDVDRAMGGRTVNLSVSAMSAFDAGRLLEAALATGKPRQVIMNLDYNMFSGAPGRSGFAEAFPAYLYDDDPWNDLPYLLGIGTTRKSVETLLGLHWSRFNTDPDRMWYWADGATFSAAHVVHGLDPANLNARFSQPPRTLEGMQASFEANLAPVIERYPGVRFTFLYAPYSILAWADFEQRRQVGVTLAFREWLFDRMAGRPNVELFDFQADPVLTEDLGLYTDIYHFSPAVAKGLMEAIAAGSHRLTRQALERNDAWLRRAAERTDPAALIARAKE
ncbi:MAG TPA: hypothetical protein VEG27_04350 [Usitatibacter sp.]|nr:hypothetical protein [Usitatibacter sp.]